jgi:hypothetical protein
MGLAAIAYGGRGKVGSVHVPLMYSYLRTLRYQSVSCAVLDKSLLQL